MKRLLAAAFRHEPFALLLRVAVFILAPRHRVGVAGIVFDGDGRILLLEHVYRHRIPRGLPGGWVGKGEDPAAALRRELREEVGLDVEPEQIILCASSGRTRRLFSSSSLNIIFRCRLAGGEPDPGRSSEILAFRWADPKAPGVTLLALHRTALEKALNALPS
jgi:8-oxo-dGTP diphosphatase